EQGEQEGGERTLHGEGDVSKMRASRRGAVPPNIHAVGLRRPMNRGSQAAGPALPKLAAWEQAPHEAAMSEQRQAQALLDTVGVHLLEAQRLIAVTGDDAVAWLQGQITQDVRALAPGHGALSLLLDKTGKVRSDAFVL